MALQTWKLMIEYDGTLYSGWQCQHNAPSIQAAIEAAIFKFCQQKIRIHAAGRTDAGVHAYGQVGHIALDYGDRRLDGFDLAKALNAHLRPAPISILSANVVADDFHARFSAKRKYYRYHIVNRHAPLTIDRHRAWQVMRSLDADAMHEAAQILLGRHDFSTFRDSECQARTPIRTLDRLDVTRQGDDIFLDVEAKSFLHHQVRNMTGALVSVGDGRWTPDDLRTVFEMRDRRRGGVTAPPDGLFLMRVDYA